MIPIRDHQGRVVAFTARQTDLTPEDDPARDAKYVNSPETPIFTKGNLLFNLDRARTAVGEGNPFVLVEGQLDALRCWSVGLKTALAPQGTSITESSSPCSAATTRRSSASSTATAPARKPRCASCRWRSGPDWRCVFSVLAGSEQARPRPAVPREGTRRLRGGEARRRVRDGLCLPPASCPTRHRLRRRAKSRRPGAVRDHRRQAESEDSDAHLLPQRRSPAQPVAPARRSRNATCEATRQRRQASGRDPNPRRPPRAAQPVGTARPRHPEAHLLALCLHFESARQTPEPRDPHDWIDTSAHRRPPAQPLPRRVRTRRLARVATTSINCLKPKRSDPGGLPAF
jgi:DNA primase